MDIGNVDYVIQKEVVIAIGIEGSANKVGVGIVRYSGGTYEILSNPRKTYITPAGQGFLPRETAWHHQQHVNALVRQVSCQIFYFPDELLISMLKALNEAQISPDEIDCICYTKGPGVYSNF